MANISNAELDCKNCHTSFSSNAELYSHFEKSECHGLADGTLKQNTFADNDSESEWEYEYSQSETETFYLTLDLPVARSDAVIDEPPGGRLTKRKDKWLNSLHPPFVDDRWRGPSKAAKAGGVNDEQMKHGVANTGNGAVYKATKDDHASAGSDTRAGFHHTTPTAGKRKRAPGNESDEDAEGETDEGSPQTVNTANHSRSTVPVLQELPVNTSNQNTAMEAGQPNENGARHDIQILELHNKKPIVIYRNQQFECNWAENIGTELLFIKHSDLSAKFGEHLPIVRKLPGEVDLLAVSGVRVVGHPVNIKTKERHTGKAPKEQHNATSQGTAIQASNADKGLDATVLEQGALRIPIGLAAGETRKEQARFLERLSAIKIRKGEHDEVTVTALMRKDKKFRTDRAKIRKREERVIRDKRASQRRKAVAQMRLQEMDAQDAENSGEASAQTKPEHGKGLMGSAHGNMETPRTVSSTKKAVSFELTSESLSKAENFAKPSVQQPLRNPYADREEYADNEEDGDEDVEEDEDEDDNDSDRDSNDEEASYPDDEEHWDLNVEENVIYESGNEQDMEDQANNNGPRFGEDYYFTDEDEEDDRDQYHVQDSPIDTHTGDADGDVDMDDVA